MINLNGNTIDSGNPYQNGYANNNTMSVSSETAVNEMQRTEGSQGVNLTELNVGDVFRGEILDINNQEVSILLPDNGVLQATMKQAFELNIGQKVLFLVKDKTEQQVFLRPLEEEGVSPDLVKRTLISTGLSQNEKNAMIVSNLIKQGQPIDRSTILNFLKLSNQYGMENIGKMMEMTKQGLTVNSETIEMYDKYVHSNHQLSNTITALPDKITGYLEGILQENSENPVPELKNFASMLNELSDVLETGTGKNIMNTGDMINIGENLNTENDSSGLNASEIFNTENAGNVSNTANSLNAENLKNALNPENAGDIQNALNPENAGDIQNAGARSVGDSAQSTTVQNNLMAENGNNILNIDSQETTSLHEAANEINAMITSFERGAAMDVKEALAKVKDKVRAVLEEKLLLDFKKSGTSDTAVKEQVDKLYEKLMKTADIIQNHVSSKNGEDLQNAANELKNNLNFMQELNQLESYVQLPVKFREEDTNGDLYVYNRNRQKKAGDEALTAFLHLDLKYLGATDVNVTLKHQSVQITFTLDNVESEQLICEHLGDLVNRLEEKGYHAKIDAKTDKKEDTQEQQNAMLPITEHNDKAVSIKRYTLDIRT